MMTDNRVFLRKKCSEFMSFDRLLCRVIPIHHSTAAASRLVGHYIGNDPGSFPMNELTVKEKLSRELACRLGPSPGEFMIWNRGIASVRQTKLNDYRTLHFRPPRYIITSDSAGDIGMPNSGSYVILQWLIVTWAYYMTLIVVLCILYVRACARARWTLGCSCFL